MTSVPALHAQQFPATSINPEKWSKTAVFNGGDNSFARGARFTTDDSQYSRPIFPLSNGAYRVSLRPSIVEQSTQDRSGVAPFFDLVNFPGSSVNPMASSGARGHVLTAVRLSQGAVILIQYISHLRLPHAKIWQRYIQ